MNRTSIEWTEFTSNPIYAVSKETGKRGWYCTKVSAGCKNCYAETLNLGRFGNGIPFTERNRDKVEWRLNERELQAILRRRKPARIFLGDMGDLFHEDVPPWWIQDIFTIMRACPQHTFQLLTKRPERMKELLMKPGIVGTGDDLLLPLPNVWLGVSVENQRMADERIPLLLETPAAVRFLSCEPLLSGLDLRRWLSEPAGLTQLRPYYQGPGGSFQVPPTDANPPAFINLVIVGGESGPGRAERKLVERCDCGPTHAELHKREMFLRHWPCQNTGWRPKPHALRWLHSIRQQCEATGVPFFFKQWGGPTPKAGGRLLDGREWNDMP